MRKRVHLALAVLLVMLAGVIAWQVLREREPVYQRKRFSFWLESFCAATTLDNQVERHVAEQAIRHIGTNALPVLIERLQAGDSGLKGLLMGCVNGHNSVPWHPYPAGLRRQHAVSGYEVLGPLASTQVLDLSRILTNSPSPGVRRVAAEALGAIGPEARLAAPALFRAAQHTNGIVYGAVFWALGQIRPDPEITIPVLVAGLDDPYPGAQWQAAIALERYGPEARAAVPALLRTLEADKARPLWDAAALPRPNRFSDTLRSALKAIDPEAAAKAGVQ